MSDIEVNAAFEELLEFIKRSRGFDFTGYKRPSLMRRVQTRMQSLSIVGYENYQDYLEVHPDEFAQLFNTILINVTRFFRDPLTWDYLQEEIIPRLAGQCERGETLRVWSAACATGEEAYTLATVLAETFGVDVLRDRVKIYATDVDEEALHKARQATYSAREMTGVPPELVAKYFEAQDSRYVFRKDLRRSVIFGRHDLIQHAPISRVHLLLCRNALMYFNAETQARILSRFHFALADGGFLVLGKAETLFLQTEAFTPVDIKRRVFTRIARANVRERLLNMGVPQGEETLSPVANHVRMREAAFDTTPLAQLALDISGTLILANQRARVLFGVTPRDLGLPFSSMNLSFRPVELRSLIEQCLSERRAVTVREAEWQSSGGEQCWLDVTVRPLVSLAGSLLGVAVVFEEVTRFRRLQDDLKHAHQELETAYEELQSTNEELETTNEELQSTVEELETTNEELQSTNEELETMNEELQSSNEELHTINDTLRQRSDELNQVNAWLESILTSLRAGVAVLDDQMHVLIWNHKAEDLWGLRDAEVVGQHFLNLDIGLPVERLRQPIRACLAGENSRGEDSTGHSDGNDSITYDAVNRRGRPIRCRVSCAPLLGAGGGTRGVILLMEERPADT